MATASSLRPVTLTLPVWVINSLDTIAEAEDRSRSSIAKRLIAQALQTFASAANVSPAGVQSQAGDSEPASPQPDPLPLQQEKNVEI
jgi:hypothetical protein